MGDSAEHGGNTSRLPYVARQVVDLQATEGHHGQRGIHERRIRVLSVLLQGGQRGVRPVVHVLLARLDEPLDPEFDATLRRARPARVETSERLAEEDAYRLPRRLAGKCVVDRVLPELDAQLADHGVRDRLWETHQLEVQVTEGVIGTSNPFRDELPDQIRVIIALPGKELAWETYFLGQLIIPELAQAVFSRLVDVRIRDIAPRPRSSSP